MIKISNLNKRFGGRNGFQVINNTSITLPDNGLITLLGESGCGKTTLLNVLGGLDKFDSGNITYDTYETNKYNMKNIDKFRNENISYIFQNYYLINNLSVYDNLRLALEILGIFDKDEVEKRIKISLNAVKMWKFRKKLVENLSGGQQQRIAIARALVKDNKLIIADEPTGNLDSENSINIMNILKNISKKKLVLLVTHNKDLAYYYSDYIYNIKDGTIIDGFVPTKGSLNQRDNAIYLGDLTKEETSTNDLDVAVYNKDSEPLKLELYCINGVYHIKSNKSIKLFDETKYKIFDGKKDDYKVEDEVVEYSTDDYKNIIDNHVFKRMFRALGSAFKSYHFARRRVKFFRRGLFIIGFIASVISIFTIKCFHVDDSSINYNKNEYIYKETLNNSWYYYDTSITESGLSKLVDAYKSGIISNAEDYKSGNLYSLGDQLLTQNEHSSIRVLKYAFNSDALFLGTDEFSSNSDVVITKQVADEIKLNLPYEKLIGKKVRLTCTSYRSEVKIIGILNCSGNFVYTPNHEILDFEDNNITYSRTNFLVNTTKYDYSIYKNASELSDVIDIVQGSLPKNKYEILLKKGYTLPSYSPFTVSGYYTLKNNNTLSTYSSYFVSEETYKVVEDTYDLKQSNDFSLKVEDISKTNSLNLISGYEYTYNVLKTEQYETLKTFLVVSVVLIVILIIYIYFTEHAKLISDIKNVGMLRAIGASKVQISGKYAAEAFVEAICTVTLGYFTCGFIAGVFEFVVAVILQSKSLLFFGNLYYYVFLFGVILIFTFFGALPSIRLMKKTPSEIIAKYDI